MDSLNWLSMAHSLTWTNEVGGVYEIRFEVCHSLGITLRFMVYDSSEWGPLIGVKPCYVVNTSK